MSGSFRIDDGQKGVNALMLRLGGVFPAVNDRVPDFRIQGFIRERIRSSGLQP